MQLILLITIFLFSFSSLIGMKTANPTYSTETRDELFSASHNNDVKTMKNLLTLNRALANSMGYISNSYPIISFTIEYSNIPCLQCLIDFGANVNAQTLYVYSD